MLFFIQYQHYTPNNPWIDWDVATSYPEAAKMLRKAISRHTEGVPWRILVRFPKDTYTQETGQ